MSGKRARSDEDASDAMSDSIGSEKEVDRTLSSVHGAESSSSGDSLTPAAGERGGSPKPASRPEMSIRRHEYMESRSSRGRPRKWRRLAARPPPKGTYSARFRVAASRHFVDIPRALPADEAVSAQLRNETDGVEDQHSKGDTDDETQRLTKRPPQDRFHLEEVRRATDEILSFKTLVNQLEAEGALGPGPHSGWNNETIALANIIAAGDILRRFPRAPPPDPPYPHTLKKMKRTSATSRLLNTQYAVRYRSYTSLYHRHALAAWPDPSAVHGPVGSLGDEVAGILDRRWRSAVKASFPTQRQTGFSATSSPSNFAPAAVSSPSTVDGKRSRQASDTMEESSSATVPSSRSPHSSSQLENESRTSKSRSPSPSLSLGSHSPCSSEHSTSSDWSSRRSSSSGSASDPGPSSHSSASSSRSAMTDAEDSEGEDALAQHHQLHALLETVDPSSALSEPLLASIEADLRKVYVMLPSLLAHRRRPGPAGHAAHISNDPSQYRSAAEWGYEGPMLDWKDMLSVLQSNGGAEAEGPSSLSRPVFHEGAPPPNTAHTCWSARSAWPPIVPGNDPRTNALRRTRERLQAIYEPENSHQPPARTSSNFAADQEPAADQREVPKTPGPTGGSAAAQSPTSVDPLHDETRARTTEAREMRQDLFTIPSLSSGPHWSSLVTDACIPI